MYRIYLLTEDGKFIGEDIGDEDTAKELVSEYNHIRFNDEFYFYQQVWIKSVFYELRRKNRYVQII